MFTGIIEGVGRIVALQPVGGDVRLTVAVGTLPFEAVQLAGSTFHCCAAACTSMARAEAPALRSGFQKARIELELPVTCMPKIGLA